MADLRDRTVVVTGASSGVGAAAARRFAGLGANVVVVGRSPERTRMVAESIGAEHHVADFSRLDDVRALADRLRDRHIDVLANNAGGVATGRRLTVDGHEATFQVNYLAPFLLTNLLLDRLTGGRVINTGSMAYRAGHLDLDHLDGPAGQRAYAPAKLAVLLFTRELARRTDSLTVAAFHPGFVASDLFRANPAVAWLVRLSRPVLSSPEQGAEPLIHLATAADPRSIHGAYFHKLRREEPRHRQVADPQFARRLWEVSARMTGVPADI